MAWWVTPALVGGLMLYAKSKATAAFRWIMSDETSVKGMPIALLLTKVSTGEALPAAPNGFQWKELELNFASSPFSTPQSLKVSVLEQWLDAAQKPAGTAGFLTAESLSNPGLMGFLTTQEVDPNHPRIGELVDRSKYLYAPATAPDFGSLGQLGQELRGLGLVLAPVGPHGIQKGDYVVTAEGGLFQALEGGQYKEMHPRAGRVGALRGSFQSAYGVRRA